MNKLYRLRFLISLLPIIIAVAIFLFSAQPADESTATSNEVIDAVVRELVKVKPNIDEAKMSELLVLPVRKLAHMTEFTALYCSLLLAFYAWQLHGKKLALLSFLITFLYACSDELHQLFIPGRASRFTDVCIDCTVALIVTIVNVILNGRE
jgi:VanZ family protein